MSPRTLKFLAIDETLRVGFAEQYRRLPLVKTNAVTTLGSIKKDTSNQVVASSCLIIGTESGELLILDPRSFSLVERQHVGWIPVGMASAGLWSGDGHIFVIGREGNLGLSKKGMSALRSWEKLAAPGVAVCVMGGTGAAVLTMSASLVGFSNNGTKLWRIKLPGIGLDLMSLPVPAAGLSLLAVSCPKLGGVAIYDSRNYVDTINMLEPVAAMKYGRMGQEDRAMAMITIGGGLSVKILKRTANFSSKQLNNYCALNESAQSSNRFAIPKKTRLFVEQTIRERSEAKEIHKTLQHGFLRLKLEVCKKVRQIVDSDQDSGPNLVSIEASVLGLGPVYQIRTMVTNVSDDPSSPGLFLVFRNKDLVDIEPKVVQLPLLPGGIPIPVVVKAIPRTKVAGKVHIVLCKKSRIQPISTTVIVLPVTEDDIDEV